jgi:hypothetical protein
VKNPIKGCVKNAPSFTGVNRTGFDWAKKFTALGRPSRYTKFFYAPIQSSKIKFDNSKVVIEIHRARDNGDCPERGSLPLSFFVFGLKTE